MEISIIRDNEVVHSYNSTIKKHRKTVLLTLCMFNLQALKGGEVTFSRLFEDLFKMNLLGFSAGKILILTMAFIVSLQFANLIGMCLEKDGLPRWTVVIWIIVILVGWGLGL